MVRPSTARYVCRRFQQLQISFFLQSSLRRVPAESLHSSPASGEAGLHTTAPAILTAEAEADGIIHGRWEVSTVVTMCQHLRTDGYLSEKRLSEGGTRALFTFYYKHFEIPVNRDSQQAIASKKGLT